MTLGTWYMAINMKDEFFSIPIKKKKQESVHMRWRTIHFQVLLLCYVTLLLPDINTVQRDLNFLDIPQNIAFIHYSDNIILIWQGEQELPSPLEALIKYMHVFQ